MSKGGFKMSAFDEGNDNKLIKYSHLSNPELMKLLERSKGSYINNISNQLI